MSESDPYFIRGVVVKICKVWAHVVAGKRATWTMVTGQPAVGEKNAKAPSRAAQHRQAAERRRGGRREMVSTSPGSKVGRVELRGRPGRRHHSRKVRARASRSRAPAGY